MSDGSASDRAAAIRVDGLRKTFEDGDAVVRAVDDVSFEIERGSLIGLLGPNGAGKTTMIKSMLGLVLPDAGTVEIGGVDVHDDPSTAYENVGAILEGARNVYWRLTVRENLRFFAGIGGRNPSALRARHDALLEQFGLADRADTPVRELSRGMKQKVSLASTLARDVDVVFMDEPTLGLDVETSLELRSELSRLSDREEVTIVVSSHDMDVIESVCDRVIVLNDGSIVEHSEVDELLEMFGTRRFRVALDGPLDDGARRRLERAVDADCTDGDHQFTVTFTATNDEAIYGVMDILRATESEIRGIESLQPDLEEIFLELTETGRSAGGEESAPAGERRTVANGDDGAVTEVSRDGNR
ncbi:ABC transporter ATP-binding protein [Natrinema marinum]|uniref:ABC transporter ATP-binding protein n=1 Tax=Natrinema marinum TaxID=2961598 RepID=UPI0020C8E6EE|nr:ABC transporter ATP-binding protein [Natrinema marinum]